MSPTREAYWKWHTSGFGLGMRWQPFAHGISVRQCVSGSHSSIAFGSLPLHVQ